MTAPLCLVTGAGRGIGRTTAATLAQRGWRVAVLDRDAESLERTGELVGVACVAAHAVDIRDGDAVAGAVATIESLHGPLTGLAHVAGVLETGSVLDSEPDSWQRVFDVNVTGLLNVIRSVGRAMRARGAGAIVVVGSNAAGVPRTGMGAYGASKAAATMIARVTGLELAHHGIRVNVVAPGSTDTDMQRSLWPDPADDTGARGAIEGSLADFKVGIPLGRIAAAEDIADSVEFLLSERARHITMQALYVDGGATLRS
ncbi:SDR family oxidoreductase [Rhodococcus hoagii]|uniref:SDR family oxidoreductase n=1 Tax=Rhodococcus hoagii TaxID=43767 RepID=UPI0019D9CCFC|nr:SDR family oxidoreductase [Prescottella equi]MDP8016535.1 SDR family oxidoreductase [Prescottella equi]NKR89617.1 SDR family oxidoreductase [Prescottella equi]NKS06828.1 SDR family oxidoreductase [Prescottella equi]NKS96013.1 SDR family oxidoreductase [Prescottella equi]NKT11904.1 SDR family oxidoreductase [Prescottella equi]